VLFIRANSETAKPASLITNHNTGTNRLHQSQYPIDRVATNKKQVKRSGVALDEYTSSTSKQTSADGLPSIHSFSNTNHKNDIVGEY
jgi:hypothetical protein